MDSKGPSDKPSRARNLKMRGRRILGVVALIIATLGTCYLTGYLHGRSGLNRLQAQLESERVAAQEHAEQLARQLDSSRRNALALDARRSLDQAIAALDARNFGIAEQQIKKAGKWLRTFSSDPSAMALGNTLEAFHLTATEDLGPQRRQVVDWVLQLDQRIPTLNP